MMDHRLVDLFVTQMQVAWEWLTGDWGPYLLATVMGGCGLGMLLPGGFQGRLARGVGLALIVASAALLLGTGPWGTPGVETVLVVVLSAVALLASVFMITTHRPIYSAVWFALTLLSVGGLFFVAGAQFLGLATVAVYAGAIVVIFLFVLMLVQSETPALCDRVSWGILPRYAAAGCGFCMAALIVLATHDVRNLRDPHAAPVATVRTEHVAVLGGQLFSRHLIEVEIAGTLLLLALVGAVVMSRLHPLRGQFADTLHQALDPDFTAGRPLG